MAIRPNEQHTLRHALFIGQSGSGKTYRIARHPLITARGARVIAWDPYQSHKVNYVESPRRFARELAAALRSGRGFRLGLSVNPTPAAFEFFCACVWSALDGEKTTVVLVEELADVATPGKASPNWGQLIRVGRKFGAVIIAATQRPQEIDKTLFTQTAQKWCGLVSDYDQPYCERNLGLKKGSLAGIEPESYQGWYVKGPEKRLLRAHERFPNP